MIDETRLQQTLTRGGFAVTCEISPPRGFNSDGISEIAEKLKGKVDAVNVNDNPNSNVRMSSLAFSKILLDCGIEPVLEQSMRDRNRIALQSDLLGAAAMGIKNVLCMTGDHPSRGDHPGAGKVFDLDSSQWIDAVRRIRDQGVLINGRKIDGRPKFFIGCTANPFVKNADLHLMRLRNKIAAGADFIQTQPVFDTDSFRDWIKGMEEAGLLDRVPIIAGVAALKSLRQAQYLKDRVSGFDIPDKVMERLKSVKEEDQQEEGIRICVEQIKSIQEIKGVRGIHIMSVDGEKVLPEIVERAGLPPRAENLP